MKVLGIMIFAVLIAALVPANSLAEDSVGSALLEVLHNKGVVDDTSYNDIKKSRAEGGDQAMNKKLLEVLHQKGVLDDATYTKLSEQATPAAEAARPFDKTFSAMEEGFARLGGDTVKLKIGAFLQAGWLADDAGFSVTVPPTTGRSTTSGNQFFVRRARLFFDGMVTDKAGFKDLGGSLGHERQDTQGRLLLRGLHTLCKNNRRPAEGAVRAGGRRSPCKQPDGQPLLCHKLHPFPHAPRPGRHPLRAV